MIYENQRKPEFWANVRNNPQYDELIQNIIKNFEETKDKGLEPLLVSKYNLYNETGDRTAYENDYFACRKLFTSAFMLSLLFPENGEYFEKLEASMWAICDEFNWVLPAHNSTHKIDLCSAETALLLIESIAFLGDRIDASLKERVMLEVKNRVIDVYENNEFVWEKYTSNWTAVCTGCVAITMMYAFPNAIERSVERIKKASEVFLSGFSDEGVCFEGPVYWGYGFGNFVYLADALYEYTNGKIDLFAIEKTKKVAEYPKYSVLCGGAAVSFSDSSRIARFSKGVMACLSKHYDIKNTLSDEFLILSLPMTNFQNALIRQFIFGDFQNDNSNKVKQNYFLPSAGQMIFNKDGYSFVIKAGNNAELHNHNDVGSFIFADVDGQALCDLGAGVYSRDYFGDKRYDILCTSSLGHNVPIINGKPQAAGKDYSGEIIANGDTVTIDFASAYDLENINLKRNVIAKENSVILTDEFGGEIERYVSRFVTMREPKVCENQIIIGKTVIIFGDDVALNIEKTAHVDSRGEQAVWLLDFAVKNIKIGKCQFEIKVTD